ncbi:MAG: rhombotarget lipoprotein [Wenzhouxiangella sp.]
MFRLVCALVLVMALSGCAGFVSLDSRSSNTSSLVDYLFPHDAEPVPMQQSLPRVELPAAVGIAFVPSRRTPDALSAAEQARLLEGVRQAFIAQAFVDRIEIIPQAHLRPGGSFADLERVAALHGVDIVALVSFDQLRQTSESARSLLYWTVIGAYTVAASRNEMVTFVDTSVIHVPSRNLLLRAAGQDRRAARSTLVNVGRVQSELSLEGFEAATVHMTDQLDRAIRDFDRRVRREARAQLIDRRSGENWHDSPGGAGGFGLFGLMLLGLLLTARRCSRQKPGWARTSP